MKTIRIMGAGSYMLHVISEVIRMFDGTMQRIPADDVEELDIRIPASNVASARIKLRQGGCRELKEI